MIYVRHESRHSRRWNHGAIDGPIFTGKNNWDVTLFDKHDGNNCSQTAAGLLTPVAELDKSDPIIFKLGYESLHRLWDNIILTLNADIYFKKIGSLLIAHPQDKYELEQYYRVISHKISVIVIKYKPCF